MFIFADVITKNKMLECKGFAKVVLDATDPMAVIEMVHNKEALFFDGDDTFNIF